MQLASPFSGLETIVTENVPLAPHTWYRIGGPARWFVRPRNRDELREAAGRCVDNGIPVYVLGRGANLLVGDDGVNGAVFHLDDDYWRKITFNGTVVEAGGGADIQKLVLKSARQGLTGLECLAGIPGTVGGAVRMNAGGKFGDIGARVSRVQVMDLAGNIFERLKDDLVFDYRSTNISAPFIIGATFCLDEDDADRLAKRLKEIWMFKRNSQPLNTKNAGCIFKNPRGLSAGALIDQAGFKGLRVGGAEVSTIHANFIVAHQGCRADDVLKLIKIVREKVYEKNRINLESEVRIWT
jgi:UDP-N-acetylmuramate dehydrogenase